MKKNFFVKVLMVFLFCAVFNGGVQAQNTFSKGDNIVNVGLGLINPHTATFGLYSGRRIVVPPVSASYEMCLIDNLFNDKSSIGVGGYFGFAASKIKDADWRYSNAIIGLRGAFHYQLVDNLDTYAGVMMGVRIHSYSSYSKGSSGYFAADTFLGARYYFANNIGAFAELGWGGIGVFQLGVAFKF